MIRSAFRHTAADRAVHAFRAVDKELTFLRHDVGLFLRHGAPDEIASPVGISCKGADDFHDLLLIYHAAVGVGQDRLQKRMGILHGRRVVLSLDIAGDLFHGAGTEQGNARDQVLKAVRLQLSHELAHAR